MKVAMHLACYPELDELWSQFSPLGLGYLISYARQYVGGIDFSVERDFENLIASKPDVACITYVTHHASHAGRLARRVKDELGIPVIVGGPHISTLPTVLDPNFDVAVISEGEETFADLMRLYKEEGKFSPQSLAKVPGILYHGEAGEVARTGCRANITNLDSIPFPDRDIMFDQWRRDKVEATIMTSRGCPYDCAFCSTVKHWGQGYRFPSNEYIIREIEEIRTKFNPTMLHFYDDLFVVRKDRVIKLLAMMRERGLHEGMTFTCFVRSNLLDEAVMEAFAKTNFNILHIGFESGSDSVLWTFNKQAADMGKNKRAIELARQNGLRFTSCFIMGCPGETRDDILKTFDFVTSSMDAFWCVLFSPLVILPGTDVWEWAKKVGVADNNLRGVVLEPEDLGDERDYIMNRWPYLNEEKMPREEFYAFLQVGHKIQEMVGKATYLQERLTALEKDSRTAKFAAENTPIKDIIFEKTKRRLRRLMPVDHRIRLETT